MHSLVKIYSDELQNRQTVSFTYTVKGYEKVYGMLVCGQGKISLVFDKGKSLIANSFDISTGKDLEPNKRALLFKKTLKDDIIQGNVTKSKADGRLSIYLIVS